MTEQPITWLTQEAHDRLVDELADLEGPKRTEIKNKIEAAREEGDLKENGGYHAAREEQGKNEARVKVLRHMLENAKIGAPPAASLAAEAGLHSGDWIRAWSQDGNEWTDLSSMTDLRWQVTQALLRGERAGPGLEADASWRLGQEPAR